VSGLTALTAGQVVEIVIYEKFQLADTVSKASGGTFNGGVTFNSGFNVGTIKEATGTTTAMTIDSTGRILTPARPVFKVTTATNQSISTGTRTTMQWTTTDFDIGSNFNLTNNQFVVPIDGVYNFSVLIRATGTTNTMEVFAVDLEIKNSGGTSLDTVHLIQMQTSANNLGNSHLGGSTLLQLQASQTVEVGIKLTGDALIVGSLSPSYNWFCGHLVG
jgi:hypothetical protein